MKRSSDNSTQDWLGEDDDLKNKPLAIESKQRIAEVARQYDDKDLLVYKLAQLADSAISDDKPQYTAAVSALAHIARINGFLESSKSGNKVTINTLQSQPAQINFIGVDSNCKS